MGSSWVPSRDIDNDFIMRPKVVKPGYTYDQRVITFTTSSLDEPISERYNGADWGDISMKFFDVNGVELTNPTQANLDSQCVFTHLYFEPSYNYDLFGGEICALTTPLGYEDNPECRVWIVGVPFFAHPVGEIEMIGGRTLRSQGTTINVDGRSGKNMVADPIYHTNELLTCIKTGSPGQNFKIELIIEHFFERV